MDTDRFDTLVKRMGAPTSRRAALRGGAAGGFFGLLGLSRALPDVRAAQGGTCVLAFVATVRQGASADQNLTPNGQRPGEVRGNLRFSLSETGNLENGTLQLPNGASVPVVGQAVGHSLQVRIELEPRVALVAIGVGEREIADCRGAIDGVATGPQVGDLGDWHAAVARRAEGSGGSNNSASSGNATQTRSNAGRGGNATRTPAGGTGAGAPTPTLGPGDESHACGFGLTRCAGECVDLNTDPAHCGACGFSCGAGFVCEGGECVEDGEPPAELGLCASRGLTDCGVTGPLCVDVQTDPAHCGACDAPCDDGVCLAGVCQGIELGLCASRGLTDCGGLCVDLDSDPSHCGDCGAPCVDGSCIAGICQGVETQRNPDAILTCAGAGLTSCGGVCVDLSSDPANCGECGVPCFGGTCSDGICQGIEAQPPPLVLATCESRGLTDCGGYCADLMNDPANCGVCHHFCESGTCMGGECVATCFGPGTLCNVDSHCCSGICAVDEVFGDGFCL